jgi:hypothetical protein
MIAGWVGRWLVAGLLYLIRAFQDMGEPWRSPGLWIDKTSVACGLLLCTLIVCVMVFWHLESLANENGYSLKHLADRAPGLCWALPGAVLVATWVFVLSQHWPEWGRQEAIEARHAALVEKGDRLEAAGRLIAPEGENAMEAYRKVLKENNLHRGAHEGRIRVEKHLLDEARKQQARGNMSAAEELFQQMLAHGVDERIVQRERDQLRAQPSYPESAGHANPVPPALAPIRRAEPVAASPEVTEKPVTSYRARISKRDHFNSKGDNLARIPNIKLQDFLQQDRYNLYRKNLRDPDDEFSNRDYGQLAGMFENDLTADTSPACFEAVLHGEPLLEVLIYRNAIRVRLLAR